MNRIQSLLTICFTLCVPILALSGQAKLGALILATAMVASIITVFYGIAQDVNRDGKTPYRYDWK